MSREALSLDISRVVSRVVSGEPIDTAANGAALAAKYPEIGMSAAAISQAIERAAGMIGMIKSAPEPVKPPRLAFATAEPKAPIASNGHGIAAATAKKADTITARKAEPLPAAAPVSPIATPVAGLSFDDALAAAIDEEIGNLVSGQRARPEPPANPVGAMRSPLSERPLPERTASQPRPMAANAAKAPLEMRVEVQPPESQPAEAASPPPAAATESSEAKADEAARGSIFSSFRRALFRA